MRHEKTRSTTMKKRQWRVSSSVDLRTYTTAPIPAMMLAQGVESAFPKPAKAPSSRNGESASRSKAIRSRAARHHVSVAVCCRRAEVFSTYEVVVHAAGDEQVKHRCPQQIQLQDSPQTAQGLGSSCPYWHCTPGPPSWRPMTVLRMIDCRP